MKLTQGIKSIFNLLPKVASTIRLNPAMGIPPIGCVVISYITWPFQTEDSAVQMRGHTNANEVQMMARTFQGLGFRVEVCDWEDKKYLPPKDTVLAIDIHANLERWRLPDHCIRVLHATGAHWSFQNRAETIRLAELEKRRGTKLFPRRTVTPSRGPEFADHIVVLGNEFTADTLRYARKPITRIPISSAYEFPFPNSRDYYTARKRFLWVGSYGMVHKGLDLVLEAFVQMPELELTVCGRPEKEEDFYRLYLKELEQTKNIHFRGWVDMASPEFAEIALNHASIVYPSCSEGGGGSVIHCMHAGMIPICTREASVDLGDFGVLIREGSVSAIQEAVCKIASMNIQEVDQRARASWKFARTNHNKEMFRHNYQEFAKSIIAGL